MSDLLRVTSAWDGQQGPSTTRAPESAARVVGRRFFVGVVSNEGSHLADLLRRLLSRTPDLRWMATTAESAFTASCDVDQVEKVSVSRTFQFSVQSRTSSVEFVAEVVFASLLYSYSCGFGNDGRKGIVFQASQQSRWFCDKLLNLVLQSSCFGFIDGGSLSLVVQVLPGNPRTCLTAQRMITSRRQASPIETAAKWTVEVRMRVREAEETRWREAMEAKSTLECYRKHQDSICGSRLYDNSIGSSLLFEARAGALRTLEYRRKFDATVVSNLCRVCGVASETQEHLVLHCRSLPTSQVEGATLPQALGFQRLDEDGSSDNGGGRYAVAATKRRLTEWWATIRRT
ncbi:hypothetical protein HPB51_024753 [Rhipicephalus microplus]|uniref:Tick transposon n=1 Tax=Rhipicephalus microplus TaxID=6941 RepID=A0A9J6D7B5_RHIMP|nr:hypothetical protein HPB51_024753 [Rhipicephalus microplus]